MLALLAALLQLLWLYFDPAGKGYKIQLSDALLPIVVFVIVLGAMIVIHEFGHFIVAKLFGIRVEVFSAGFGKRLFGIKKGDTDYLPGQFVDRFDSIKRNEEVEKQGGEAAQLEDIILGITKASLNTDSFLSAASFEWRWS